MKNRTDPHTQKQHDTYHRELYPKQMNMSEWKKGIEFSSDPNVWLEWLKKENSSDVKDIEESGSSESDHIQENDQDTVTDQFTVQDNVEGDREMWSDGGVEGLTGPLFGGGVHPREAGRHLWGSSSSLRDQLTDDRVSSSTSPSQEVVAVDLSLKSQADICEAVSGGRHPSTQPAVLEKLMKGKGASCREEIRLSSDDEDSRLVIVEPSGESERYPTPPPPAPPTRLNSSNALEQTEQSEFTSIKEVLLEMTNRKNGHTKLAPARWGIMKKEMEQVPKFVVEEKKCGFQRPTALVNPFPADIPAAMNGTATLQTSITDWINGRREIVSRDNPKNCVVSKVGRPTVRQRSPRNSNGKIVNSKKKPLNAIVAELAGSVQCSQASQSVPVNPGILQTLLVPSESYISSHRLSGGEVSISEVTPDSSVVDRLKRLGTVIEVEEKAESNSLKMLEKITKSVSTDGDGSTAPIPFQQLANQPVKHASPKKLPPPHQLPVQLHQTTKKNMSKNRQIQISGSQVLKVKFPTKLPSPEQTQVPVENEPNQLNKNLPIGMSNQIQKEQNQPLILNTNTSCSSLVPLPSSEPIVKIKSPLLSPNTQSNNQTLKVQPPTSFTPRVQLSVQKGPNKKPKAKQAAKTQQLNKTPSKNHSTSTSPQVLIPSIGALYISKDVTLIPKLPIEQPPQVQEKIEPSLFEPVIDIVEEESALSSDGKFLFKTDSFHNMDMPSEHKVYSCDICSAVYSHSNLLRKHYLRLHISRKYISEKDMETFNIDPEPANDNETDKLVFRCHTCRECFPTKNDLRSHLTDHPPVVELSKQNNKSHPYYKCENCSSMFKWRKQFGKHKKSCKPSPPPAVPEKTDLSHCLYCNETFSNGNAKRNHILSNHPYVRRKHCCVFCKREFPNNVSLFQHLLNDHTSVYFACHICKERFTNLEELKIHADNRHEQDEKFRTSLAERVSTLSQDKDYYSCDSCQRKFLVEDSLKEHICGPEKQEKPNKLQKIKRKVAPLSERLDKCFNRNQDQETIFFSRVALNVRDNLLHYLDGKINKEESSEEDKNYGAPSPNVSGRTFLNFSAGFPPCSEIETDNGLDTPTRAKAPWEKYTFPKNYDGRCGLTSYIKDTSYLDISTQLIMRRNLQRLNMLPMKESCPEDVPSVLALERLSAECAESYGQLKEEKKEDVAEENVEVVSLSGEWVRERMYVCSACRWESPCLWTMEDHKYMSHPRVHCPQHELIGDQTSLTKTIYKRLVTEVPSPFAGPTPQTLPSLESISCTKCSKTGFSNQAELHVHILECAGVVVEPIGPFGSGRKKRRRTRRRPRRGLKRNIPSTPQKLPPKLRTKPGDTDTIERMIANLPAKRVSRKVLSAFEEEKARQNAQKNVSCKGGKNQKSPGKRSRSEPRTPTKEEEEASEHQVMLQRPTMIKKAQDYIDTSAEGGNVLSSLRMMPVRAARKSSDPIPNLDSMEKKEVIQINNLEDKEMPKLEIEKDISPVESAEIPVLSPVERKDDVKKEKDDLVCENSPENNVVKSETVPSFSQETQGVRQNQRKRKSNSKNANLSAPKTKKSKGQSIALPVPPPISEVKIKDEPIDDNEKTENTVIENVPPKITDNKTQTPKGANSGKSAAKVSASKKSLPVKKSPALRKNSTDKVTTIEKENTPKQVTAKKIATPKEPANKKNTPPKKLTPKKVKTSTGKKTISEEENSTNNNKTQKIRISKKTQSSQSMPNNKTAAREIANSESLLSTEFAETETVAGDITVNVDSIATNNSAIQDPDSSKDIPSETESAKTLVKTEISMVANDDLLHENSFSNISAQLSESCDSKVDIPNEAKVSVDSFKEDASSGSSLPGEVVIKVERSDSIEREIKEGYEPNPKRRGRPKGSLTKKSSISGMRRSSRKSVRGGEDSIKFDEILPCEENDEVVKKTEKPLRKPRIVKERMSVDSTTIVVQAEVHPVPILKRKVSDEYSFECSEPEMDVITKKPKEEAVDICIKTEVSNENEDVPEVVNTASKTPEIHIKEEIVEQNETIELSSIIEQGEEPDTSSVQEQNVQSFSIDLTSDVDLPLESEAIVSTSVSDNHLQLSNTEEYECNSPEPVVKIEEPGETDKIFVIDDETSTDQNQFDSSHENSHVQSVEMIGDSNIEELPTVVGEDILEVPSSVESPLVKKKKINKKIKKRKKEESDCLAVESQEDDDSLLERLMELEKSKKIRKLSKKEAYEIYEAKKLRKASKKKIIIKKVVKLKKRFANKNNPVGEVLNIAGFKWEVSALESLPPAELNMSESEPVQSLPDSSVNEPLVDQPAPPHENSPPILSPCIQMPLASAAAQPSNSLSDSVLPHPSSVAVLPAASVAPPLPPSSAAHPLPPLSAAIPPPLSSAAISPPPSSLAVPPPPPSAALPPPPPSVALPPPPPSAALPSPPPSAALLPPPSSAAPPPRPSSAAIPPPPSSTALPPPSSSAALPPVIALPQHSQTAVQSPLHQTPPTLQTWESTSWEQSTPDPSIGTIIDSVNKLLNEPESTYTPLGLPSYSLADLQKAMGASDDEMAVLQQLGEASLQVASSESGNVKGGDNGEWGDEKCIMDLDNQASLPKQPEPSISALPEAEPSSEPPGTVKESTQEWRWREKSPSVGSSSLLEAHQGKEVLCPSCSCHFMGFPALQRHLAKAHPTVGPNSTQKRGAGTAFTKTDLNRRMPLDSSQGPRLVCFSCQQILPADRMSLHLEQEHDISPEEVSKCSTLTGEIQQGPVIGERLKSKMSSKLGDLLDRAVNNLLQAKHKPNNTLSGGAVELLTKLCAVRKREGSVKHRLHGAREFLSKLQRQQDGKGDEPDDTTKVFKTAKLFSCQICGLKFNLPSSRNKHEVLAHRSFRPAEYEAEEYENDWREAPSPPEVKGDNGGESAIFPQCSDCGLSFDSIQEMMRHRIEDHTTRRSSVDASNSNTGGCPSPVPSSVGSRSLPDSEGEGGGGDSDSTGNGRRRRSTRKQKLSQSRSRSVKERAEAALRELNHPKQRADNKKWLAMKQRAAEVYTFTDESL